MYVRREGTRGSRSGREAHPVAELVGDRMVELDHGGCTSVKTPRAGQLQREKCDIRVSEFGSPSLANIRMQCIE